MLNSENMDTLLVFEEYLGFFRHFIISFLISFLLCCLSILLVYQRPSNDKLSVYECGFNPYGDARSKFEIKFYLVGILFIIFDLEILYLLAWVIACWEIAFLGHLAFLIFLVLLICGFVYEFFLGIIDLIVE